jgi:hypothetical protein
MLRTATGDLALADQLRTAMLVEGRRRAARLPSSSWSTQDVAESNRLRAALKAQWAEREGLVEAGGRMTYQRLFGRIGDIGDWQLPYDDHVSMWRRPTDRGSKISHWISQPYPLSAAALKDMYEAAQRLGLEFSISTWPAWHYPGSVLFVEWRISGSEATEIRKAVGRSTLQ